MRYNGDLVQCVTANEDPEKDEAHELWVEDGLLCVNARVFAEICFRVGPKAAIRALHEYRDPIILYPSCLPEGRE